MTTDLLPIAAMERAVDIVLTSPHPTSKVAAALFGKDLNGDDYIIARTNHWPKKIDQKFDRSERIGDSSATLHAETACILAAPYTKGASICVTDPFCPNCAKNIVEAGIKAVYIDHKGFIKDFAARRGHEFENMSLKIVERAGIAIFEVIRKDRIIQPIQVPREGYRPKSSNPTNIVELDARPTDALFASELDAASQQFAADEPFCLAFSEDKFGQLHRILLRAHRSRGIKDSEPIAPAGELEKKYNYTIAPLNRLMLGAHKYGHRILEEYVYLSHIPSARELINLMGEEQKFTLKIGRKQKETRYSSPGALDQLVKAGLLNLELV
jgi:dCMP deaminase